MLHTDYNDPFLLVARQNCVPCNGPPAPIQCPSGQVVQEVVQTCSACAYYFCENISSGSGKSGVSAGALAGAVIGCIILLTLVVTGFLIWRRRARTKKAAQLALEKNTISPFDLNGPSVINSPLGPPGSTPTTPISPHSSVGADLRFYSAGVINLDPNNTANRASPTAVHGEGNPFSDSASMSTMGTNVIPIAYVPPSSHSMSLADGMSHPPSPGPLPPSRPARSPDLNLKLPPHAISRASLMDAASSQNGTDLLAPRSAFAAQSTKSGVSGVSSRASTISSVSSVLNERPVIVTSAKVGRQVLGVVRAEVVPTPNSSAPNTPSTATSGSLHPGLRSRPSLRSPLAAASFTQQDIELQDEVPPLPGSGGPISPSMSVKSNPFSDQKSPNYHGEFHPLSPTNVPLPLSRPGTGNGPEGAGSPTSPTFTTYTVDTVQPGPGSGRLLTPLDRSQYPPMPPVPPEADTPRQKYPRESASSFISATSRADSIFNNGFVFLPPSPNGSAASFTGTFGRGAAPEDPREKPGRRTLGFSTVSTSSNASNGLEAFPFQFGPSANGGAPAMPQSMSLSTLAGAGVPGGVPSDGPPRLPFGLDDRGIRASLDTLALSRDVEAYPLEFDRESRR